MGWVGLVLGFVSGFQGGFDTVVLVGTVGEGLKVEVGEGCVGLYLKVDNIKRIRFKNPKL